MKILVLGGSPNKKGSTQLLKKLLVDTQKDADFDYLRGSESANMFQLAFDQYTINTQRLMRYAKRRSISQEIQELINQTK